MSYIGNIFSMKMNYFLLNRAADKMEGLSEGSAQYQQLWEKVKSLSEKIEIARTNLGKPNWFAKAMLPKSLTRGSTETKAEASRHRILGTSARGAPQGVRSEIKKELDTMKQIIGKMNKSNAEALAPKITKHYNIAAKKVGFIGRDESGELPALTDAEKEYIGLAGMGEFTLNVRSQAEETQP